MKGKNDDHSECAESRAKDAESGRFVAVSDLRIGAGESFTDEIEFMRYADAVTWVVDEWERTHIDWLELGEIVAGELRIG